MKRVLQSLCDFSLEDRLPLQKCELILKWLFLTCGPMSIFYNNKLCGVSEKVHSLVDDDRVFDCFSGIANPIKDTWWNVVATIGFGHSNDHAIALVKEETG